MKSSLTRPIHMRCSYATTLSLLFILASAGTISRPIAEAPVSERAVALGDHNMQWRDASNVPTVRKLLSRYRFIRMTYSRGGKIYELSHYGDATLTIEGLDLSHSVLTEEDLSALTKFRRLRVLILKSATLCGPDAIARYISQLRNIEWLDLSECRSPLGARQLKALSFLRLRGIVLKGNVLMDTTSLIELSRISSTLTSVDISGCNMDEGAWAAIASLAGLQELIARGPKIVIDDKTMSTISTMSSLRRIDISYTNVDMSAFHKLALLKHLASLKAGGLCFTGEAMAKYAEETNISVIDCPNATFEGDSLIQLAGIGMLQEVVLDYSTGVTDVAMEKVILKNPIEALSVVGCDGVGSLVKGALGQGAALKSLNVSETSSAMGDLKYLLQMHRLEELSCWGVALDGAAVSRILQCRTIKRLNLADCDIDDAELSELAKLPALKWINVSNNPAQGIALGDKGAFPCLRSLVASGMSQLQPDYIAGLVSRGLRELTCDGSIISNKVISAMMLAEVVRVEVRLAFQADESELFKLSSVPTIEILIIVQAREKVQRLEAYYEQTVKNAYYAIGE